MLMIFKQIIGFLGKSLSFFFPSVLLKSLRASLNFFYTGFISRRFYKIGKNSTIAFKLLGLHGANHISIGYNTFIGRNTRLTMWNEQATEPGIIIGNNCNIGDFAHITALKGIIIGDNLLSGTNLLISDNSHGGFDLEELKMNPIRRDLTSKGPVNIGNNVWIGNNVCVLQGVTIGDGAVIGANSVVTKDIPSFSVAVGVPARVVKKINFAK